MVSQLGRLSEYPVAPDERASEPHLLVLRFISDADRIQDCHSSQVILLLLLDVRGAHFYSDDVAGPMEERVADEGELSEVVFLVRELVTPLHEGEEVSPTSEVGILSHICGSVDVEEEGGTYSGERDLEVRDHLR